MTSKNSNLSEPMVSSPRTVGDDVRPASPDRRKFLGRLGGLTAATLAAGAVGVPALLNPGEARAQDDYGLLTGCTPGCNIGPESGVARANHAFRIRVQAATQERSLPIPRHRCNGDEALYADRRFFANFTKGLPHDDLGEVDATAYCALRDALRRGRPDDFENIPMGCPEPDARYRLVNPQAGLACELNGADSHHLAIPPAPRFDSAEEAGEMAELYWMALARDVPFTQYAEHPTTQRAAADLSNMSDFRGPKVGGQVTPATLFRGFTAGDRIGPYISQFLLRPVSFGAESFVQKIRTVGTGRDYMTNYSDWLAVQRGCKPGMMDAFESEHCYVRNGRDLGQYVHVDVLFQAYFNACLILGTRRDPVDPEHYGGLGAPLNSGNPYKNSQTQDGFGTFGDPHIKSILGQMAVCALKAVWYQKWLVHRRLRPEAFGGRVHNHVTGLLEYPIHEDLLQVSTVLDEVFGRYGAYLLPMAFPEGSPLHPAYGAGHATVAGACVTVLKAWFDESYVLPDPVVPTPDGRALVLYRGPDADRLTVGNELNKLAANIGVGRNFAGVHWRSDYTESLKLGEAVAISVLRDQKLVYNERYPGFIFTQFDGTPVTV